MADDLVLIEPHADGVVVLRLNNPPMNPLSRSLLERLRDVARSVGTDALVKAVSRATRPPGKHNLVWDGKDDKSKDLPQGTYMILVEVHREHGKLVRQSGKLVCAEEQLVHAELATQHEEPLA